MTARRNGTGQDTQQRGTSVGTVPADRLHAVFDAMFDGVWMVAPDGRTTYANAAMASLLGVTPEELLQRSLTDFLPPELHAEARAFLDRQRTAPGERIEFRFRRADGRELIGMLAASPITGPGGVFVGSMLNFSDVTGKRAFEGQLMQDEKMRAIGEFAGGIAHDFNNLLTAIRGHAELAAIEAPEDSPLRADLDQIILSTERAGLITRSLLAFTRRQVLEPVVIDPGDRIAGLLPLLRGLAGPAIEVELTAAPGTDRVVFDPVQFEQVIINLVMNARDAMPDGGRIQLDVRNSEPARRERPDAITVPDRTVRISVADTGHGMDEATRSRVFDPFFTTKGLGRSTGLGLATVFGVVTQSGGAIQVESAPGAGSRFIIDLPGKTAPVEAVPAPQPSEPALAPTDSSVPDGLEVLLVDDEPAIREIGRRSLERAGHRVRASASGEDALAQVARAQRPIDVVVTDVVMPGMHGPELAERLRAQWPEIAIVLMSGYAQEMIEGADHAFDAFLSKPFEPARLLEVVARVGRERADRAMLVPTPAREGGLEPVDVHAERVQHPTRTSSSAQRRAGSHAHASARSAGRRRADSSGSASRSD